MAGRRPRDPSALLAVIKFGLVALMGASSTFMALLGDAALHLAALAGVAGLVVGLVVVWIAFPAVPSRRRDGPDEPRW